MASMPQLELVLRGLLKTDPRVFHQRLLELLSAKEARVADVHWHGLAESAAGRALRVRPPSLDLADAAIKTYEWLARQKPEGDESFVASAMTLRVGMICRLGPVSGSSVLDPECVVKWAREAIDLALPERLVSAQPWNPREIEELRLYRKIKNRLQVLAPLADLSGMSIDDTTAQWLRARAALP